MAQEFGVSRNTVRQALDLLASCKIVSRKPGSGSFVIHQVSNPVSGMPATAASEPDGAGADIAEITSPLELNVVRTIIEPEMVRLAVINMSARDIGNLREVLEKLEAITTSAADFAYWDEQFHMAIAKGTHNPLLIAIYRSIDHVRRHAHWGTNKEKMLSPNRIREYQKVHRSIYEALEARDIESAVEFIKLHLIDVQRGLMDDR